MGVPMVNSCCCYASLHTGTLVIGYLYTIWALLELAGLSLLVTLVPLGKAENISTHKYVLYITAAVVSGTHLLCSVLLIVAAYKKLASLTLPWTIVTGILTAVFFIMCLTGISLILQDTGEMLEVESIVIFAHLFRACVSVYCIVVVHSRHKQMMNEEDEERFQHSARLYQQKLASLTLPWTIVTGILTAVFFIMCLTGISLILQDTGEMLEVESIVIFAHLFRACVSVYCIVVVHSRHKQMMNEEDEERFQHSARLYQQVRTADHML